MTDPNDRDWGGNLVAQLNYNIREVIEWSESMDDYDLNSADEKSCQSWREMRKNYVASALKLVDLVAGNPALLREQLESLLRDH